MSTVTSAILGLPSAFCFAFSLFFIFPIFMNFSVPFSPLVCWEPHLQCLFSWWLFKTVKGKSQGDVGWGSLRNGGGDVPLLVSRRDLSTWKPQGKDPVEREELPGQEGKTSDVPGSGASDTGQSPGGDSALLQGERRLSPVPGRGKGKQVSL